VQELNWVRTQPSEAADCLRARLEHYQGREYFPPGKPGACFVTKEGPAVVREAVAVLLAVDPLDGLGKSSEVGLAFAGEDHIADIGQTGTASHSSSDGTSSGDRAHRYGTFSKFGECLWYGSDAHDARSIVLDLIIDDGVPSRGHRNGVLNPEYDTVGVAYGHHTTFGMMAAMEFACGWEGSDMFIRARKQSGPVKLSPHTLAKAKAAASTQWALGSCAICKEPIKGGKVIESQQIGGRVHAACFNCKSCAKSLVGGTYKMHQGGCLCTECYSNQHGEKCTACGKAIAGSGMKCSLGSFHIECVVCSACGKAIGRERSAITGGAIMCQACAGSAAAMSRRPKSTGALQHGKSLSAAGTFIAKPQSPAGALRVSNSSGATRRTAAPPGSRAAGTSPRSGSRPVSRSGGAAAAPAKAPHQRNSPKVVPAKAQALLPAKAQTVSMARAKNTTLALGMDYANLD